MHAHGQYRWLFLFFFLGNSVIRFSPEAAPTTKEDLIRTFVNETMACEEHKYNPALSIAVVKDGNVVFADGFGLVDGTDKNSRTPTGDTLFGIASLTKAFTATLLVKEMLDKGIPLYKYLKDKTLFYNSKLFKEYQHRIYATVKDALSHRLGFANHNFIRFGKTRNQDMFHITKNLKMMAAIRTSYYYSNPSMYGLMANLTEKLGNDKWENLMTSQILKPIGMNDTEFSNTANFTQLDIAEHVVVTEGTLYKVPHSFSKKWGEMAGSGNILSSAKDMAKWMNFVLSKGKDSSGKEVVAEEVIDEIFRVQIPIPPTAVSYMKYFLQGTSTPSVPITFTQDVYLLGWRQGYYRGLPVYTHTGSTWGSSSFLMLIPSKNLGVYVGMTGMDKDYLFRTTTLTYIADLYLGETPWINSTGSCVFPAPYFDDWNSTELYIDRTQNATRPLTEYLGTYKEALYGELTVTLTEANICVTYGWTKFKLYPKDPKDGEDKFYMAGLGDLENVINFPECMFHYDGTKVVTLSMTTWEPIDIPVFTKV